MHQLSTDHNVYILGAGFSRAAGYPLLSDFMLQMRDALHWHQERGNTRAVEAISKVLDFRLDAASAAYRVRIDLENVEDLFSLASASGQDLEEAMRVAIAATIHMAESRLPECAATFTTPSNISFTPNHWYASEFDAGTRKAWTVPAYEFTLRTLIGAWGSDIPPTRKTTIISFNYDLIVEHSLARLGVPFGYGFLTAHDEPNTTPRIELLKLHGSVNWVLHGGDTTKLDVASDAHSVIFQHDIPALLPPTWRKDALSAFDRVWRRALAAIGDATRIAVIGFSIPDTDSHFRYLLAAGLARNISLREILFVDPNLDVIRDRAQKLFANTDHNAARTTFLSGRLESICAQGTNSPCARLNRPIPFDIQNVAIQSVSRLS